MKKVVHAIVAFSLLTLASACSDKKAVNKPQIKTGESPAPAAMPASTPEPSRDLVYTEERTPCKDYHPERKALFGDLHVHTALSFDAVAGRINTRPADAYAFAQGKSIPFFPQGDDGKPTTEIALERPLDFVAVTDHSEFLGERELCTNPESPAYAGEFCTKYREVEFRGTLMLASVIEQTAPRRIPMLCGEDGALCKEWSKGPWQETVAAAEEAYDRSENCEFTSFIGYEYTGTPGNSNYHRNVIFRNNVVPASPVSFVEAPKDYLLWEQLDEQCGPLENCDYMTIPHNSNMSNGHLLSPYANLEPTAENKQAYARARLNREPLMEIFQHKGGSECVNGLESVLGAPDELCDIEQVRVIGEISRARDFHLNGSELVMSPEENVATVECPEGQRGSLGMFAGGCISRNDFLRTALLTGMEEQQSIGLNPIKLGVIASTDGHTGTPGNVAESEWKGTVSGEMSVGKRLQPGTLPSGIKGNPGGLAGVWAVENSRDGIFQALEQRETFGTSGPRISPRFFAGWEFDKQSCDLVDMPATAYAQGVPMGSDLPPPPAAGNKPTFILAANRDPAEGSTPLQQLQLIKGWVDAAGERHTRVITVAGSSDNGAGVNLQTGERHGDGFDRLCQVFEDTEFDPAIPAYYYLRAVENPSPRWSLYDCLGLPVEERPEACADLSRHVIQEMAWSSPIWYTPEAGQDYQARIENAESEPHNWRLHGRTLDEQRFSPLDSINTSNVDQLGLAWHIDLPEPRGQEATPIVIDGVMYTTAAWSEVFALNARTGKQLWHFNPEVDKSWGVKACCDAVNRGVAVWQDKVYVGTLDGRLIALDRKTGKQAWSVLTIDKSRPYTITGAPRIANGKVFIGNGGAEFGVRGFVSAYDTATGEMLWRFYTVPGNPENGFEDPALEMAAKTWNGQWWEIGGGGTVWDSMAYDPDLNLLYIGVGNGSPWNPNIRSDGEGDNLFLSSIVALNADSGEYVWHYQTTPGEGWDYTATQHMILADLTIEGKLRKVIMQAPKNGFFYVLDRATGEFISAEAFVPTTWASHIDPDTGRPVVEPAAQYWKTGEVALVTPAWAGGHSWHPMSYSPDTGLVYIPAQEMAFPYMQDNAMKLKSVGANLGVDTTVAEFPDDVAVVKEMKAQTRGHLAAWDPVTQKELWRVQHNGPLNGGILSTAGNLVIQGDGSGLINAYRATDGEKLWEFPAQTGIVAPPISYEIDGEQYITVMAGWGGIISLMTGPFTWNSGEPVNRSRVLTFRLNGKDQLPAVHNQARVMPDHSDMKLAEHTVRKGFELYDGYCGPCHGAGAVGGGVIPDLRYSAFLGASEPWLQVVRDGALASRGMASFKAELSEEQADAIRHYIIDRNQYAHSIGDTQRVSR